MNRSDRAAKEHDIWYRNDQKTEDRWVTDKVTEYKECSRGTV